MAKRKYNRKRKSKPTNGRRGEEQRVRDRLAHAQDDAQRLNIIPTLPEEVLRSARVDPSTQGEQYMPELVGRAMRNGWEPTEEMKIDSVDELHQIIRDPEAERHVKVQAVRVLQQGDQIEHERKHPTVKPGTEVNVNISNNNMWQPIFQAQGQVPDEVEERLKQVEAEVKVEEQGDDAGRG